jgi:hypothetical protein
MNAATSRQSDFRITISKYLKYYNDYFSESGEPEKKALHCHGKKKLMD